MINLSKIGSDLIEILNDMELILNSDKRFLLSNWLNDAKSKATNRDERELYEWNARTQLTLWGLNTTDIVNFLIKVYFKTKSKILYKIGF